MMRWSQMYSMAEVYAEGEATSVTTDVIVHIPGETHIAGKTAILPRISGRDWIFGFHRIGLDQSDPYPPGYVLSDTWGKTWR